MTFITRNQSTLENLFQSNVKIPFFCLPEKEIKKNKMKNTPNNSNKDKTEGIANRLFLPYERGYGEKIKRIAKKHC